ncbi:aldo/keto reductase [Actinocrispum wychmicini]|uniref:Aryl-alcohol dehydrogenase-like predicted oxidoreductase n=1 Tax=Actinocrispum wychmicini TaxID=1213861 RepID=A0A4R2K4N0_9PSEU|nr:aldo/keto reductase [Actinocrispum wychmicini]TCO64776.1 aryl-alcohol dehydrogenase-like predicted oxidoreductase [Actinocrispum wychmicini]
MKRVELGRTGQTVSQVSLGCMLMGTSTDPDTSARILDSYLDSGGDFLDTANCYAWWTGPTATGDESEELLGRLLAGRRDKVFLATKAGGRITDLAGARTATNWEIWQSYFEGAGADTIRRGIDDSLRRLNTDHVDLYYVHVDDMATPLEETLAALDEIVRAGKVRYIGWSNVRTWRLERIRGLAEQHGWPKPVAVQQRHSYLRPVAGTDLTSFVGDEMLHWLRANEDVSLVPYSPILAGLYEDPARRTQDSVWQHYAGADSEARLANVAKVAGELGVTGSQVVLAWLRHQGAIPIIGPRTWEFWEAYRPAFDLTLSAEHLALLGD